MGNRISVGGAGAVPLSPAKTVVPPPSRERHDAVPHACVISPPATLMAIAARGWDAGPLATEPSAMW